jgi:rubrerythrin
MSEVDPSGFEDMRGKKSLKEILEVAISFEAAARDLYSGLVSKVSKNLRWLLEELAREEQRHHDLFLRLAARKDLEQQIQAQVATPASDGRFSDMIQITDLGERPDDQTVLQYAMGREHAAMEHYRALAETTEPGPVRELFAFLADEETRHKAELEKLYYEVVHSGGV